MRRHTAHRHGTFNIFQFLVFISLLAIGVYGFFLWQTGRYGKFDRFNLVLQGEPVKLVSIDLNSKTAVIVSFPDDLYIPEVMPSYGGYPVAAVYRVGQLDKKGGQVLSDTVGNYLGVPVDGFALYSGKLTDPQFLAVKESNLNFVDKVRILATMWGIRFDKITTIDLTQLATPLILADGTLAKNIDKEVLDAGLPQTFIEERVRDEGQRVEVINSTPIIGLGAKVARVLTNIGTTVVNVGSGTEQLNQCEVRGVKSESMTVKRLAAAFSCKIVAANNSGRADVSLVLAK